MKHPEISDWADYVRAVAEDGERAAMQKHLDAGCEPCRATLAALERVATTTGIDAALAPPAASVRSAKAFFDIQHRETRRSWTELVLKQASDGALIPAMASGASERGPRELLFESDDYTLELSVDHSPGEVDAVLRGQILEAHGEPRSHTPVFLVGDGEVIGRAISQRHGTFEMSGPADRTCELWIVPDDRNRIRLSLKPEH